MIKDLIKCLDTENNIGVINLALETPVEFYGLFTVRGSRSLGRKRIVKLIEVCYLCQDHRNLAVKTVAAQIYKAVCSAGWIIYKEVK